MAKITIKEVEAAYSRIMGNPVYAELVKRFVRERLMPGQITPDNTNPNIPPGPRVESIGGRQLESINEPPPLEPEPPLEALTAAFIDPAEAEIGAADVEMHVVGTGFTDACVITFNGGDEPTTFVSTTDIFTIVKPSLAMVAGAFPVTVKRGADETAPIDFTFTEGA